MKGIKTIKKILSIFLILMITLLMSSCSEANFSLNRDGSGTVVYTISKNYEDENGEIKTYTREELDKEIERAIISAEECSGQENRLKLKSVQETDEVYIVKMKYMRIQYISDPNSNAGNLGIYTYKKTRDFVKEIDSISILKDDWAIGSFRKPVNKVDPNLTYKFNNSKFGSDDSKIVPYNVSTKKYMTEKQMNTFFSENGMLGTDKKGRMFTFIITDIAGLEKVTFNFKGEIKVYGANNVESVTKSSITLNPTIEKVQIIDEDANVTVKDVNCFIGYVYITLSPNYILLGILGIIIIAIITLLIIGLINGKVKKALTGKKARLIYRNYDLYIMLLPAMTLLFIFAYLPMVGVSLAFKNYKINDGIFGSEWASMGGFKHFYDLFTNPASDFGILMKNTFLLAFWKFIFGFLIAIILAVLFNYLKEGLFKKSVQTISYFPYFISWVVISTIAYALLATDGGTINAIRGWFNKEPINFYASPKYWRLILTFSAMWKTAGYSTIVYLAAIAGIDQSLYEAAKIDGANRVGQLIHITLPGLFPVIGIQIVFSLGNLVKDDFDQIYTMIRGSALLRDTTDTIGMIVYENISNPQNYSGVAAMGMLQGLIALLLVVISNKVLKHYGIEGAY